MGRAWLRVLAGVLALAMGSPGSTETPGLPKSVEQIVDSARKSVVIVTFTGRDGKRQGLGTGFVVGRDGLIATNYHVLGEGRPISVQTTDGRRLPVTAIHASDRLLDLAVLRVDAKDLNPLELGDSDQLKDGEGVVALGNPRGLAYSVVSGVVSARREIDGRRMIQIAIPIESGNSGGPLLDLRGRAQGIITMKSAVTSNLGFAIPINSLRPLLARPNPIAMDRWLTIGALDPADWKPVFEGRWRQRAGKIIGEGLGSGFGGRTLCLSQKPLPQIPYEVEVTVRLDNESGAAGLVFHADGGDRHYGFYPSAGQLRLTRFDGPDVYSWTILKQIPSPDYRLGEWNSLKVRIEQDRFLCYVNDKLLVESRDNGLTGGKVGLAKFRDTRAEFKGFLVGRHIAPNAIAPDTIVRITKAIANLPANETPGPQVVEGLVSQADASLPVLRERANQLEKQAAQLRDLAGAVHQRRVQSELQTLFRAKEEEVDLLTAALLIARLDNEELDVEVYRREVERMARDIAAGIPKKSDDKARLDALNRYLFSEHGYHGSRTDYYNRANSYLNEVIDDREGLPITLSVLYMELARRIGIKVVGVSLPAHFVVKFIPSKGDPELIDVFNGARPLARKEAEDLVKAVTERHSSDVDFSAVSKKSIIVRMIHNLMGVARTDGDVKAALRYLDTILAVDPLSANDRLLRAGARYQVGNSRGALEDVDWLLEHKPEGTNAERLLEFRRVLTKTDG